MSLYNAKTITDSYRITKFDDDLNPEASYETSPVACTCPAGHRDTCRHRQMLPYFNGKVNTYWFLDWDNKRWLDPHNKAWRRI